MADKLLVVDCESGDVGLEESTAKDRKQRDADVAVAVERQKAEEASAQRRQQGIDAYRDLVAVAKDTGQQAITRRIARDAALAIRALAGELRDDTSLD